MYTVGSMSWCGGLVAAGTAVGGGIDGRASVGGREERKRRKGVDYIHIANVGNAAQLDASSWGHQVRQLLGCVLPLRAQNELRIGAEEDSFAHPIRSRFLSTLLPFQLPSPQTPAHSPVSRCSTDLDKPVAGSIRLGKSRSIPHHVLRKRSRLDTVRSSLDICYRPPLPMTGVSTVDRREAGNLVLEPTVHVYLPKHDLLDNGVVDMDRTSWLRAFRSR